MGAGGTLIANLPISQVMIVFGYFVVLFAALWLIGPLLGILVLPVLTKRVERHRRSGNPVAADLRTSGNPEWSDEQRLEVLRLSDAVGTEAVLWGRTLAAGLIPVLYLEMFIPKTPWWFDVVPKVVIWWMSRDRLLSPAAGIALQLGIRPSASVMAVARLDVDRRNA